MCRARLPSAVPVAMSIALSDLIIRQTEIPIGSSSAHRSRKAVKYCFVDPPVSAVSDGMTKPRGPLWFCCSRATSLRLNAQLAVVRVRGFSAQTRRDWGHPTWRPSRWVFPHLPSSPIVPPSSPGEAFRGRVKRRKPIKILEKSHSNKKT